MRIIAGKARGRKLIPPATMETRPTLDRVKEAMFSTIQVYLVDKSAVTFPLLKENVDNLKFSDFCFPLNKDSYDVLRDLAKKGKVMDVIFIDPPYCKEMIPEAMKIIEENKMLNEDGIIVTKIDSIEEIYEGYGSIKLYKSKKYGNTTVCYYKIN